MITLLSSSLDRHARLSEQTIERVEALGRRVDTLGDKVSNEIGSAMRHQTRMVALLVGLSLILLGAAAGVSFMGKGLGLDVSASGGSLSPSAAPPASSPTRSTRSSTHPPNSDATSPAPSPVKDAEEEDGDLLDP